MATTQSETGSLQRVLLKHPNDAFRSTGKIDAEWRSLQYAAAPDLARAIDEYDRFVALLREAGSEVVFAPADESLSLDSIYVRDAALMTDDGAILCSMAKEARAGEPAALETAITGEGIPVIGRISPPGLLEGGDACWLGPKRLAIGRGYRTNDEGIRQLKALLGDRVDELVVVPLPHWKGAADVFHLMSVVSPVDHDTLLAYSRLLPVPFRERLLTGGTRLIEVPDEEFAGMACNVFALAPGKVLMLDGNPITRRRLEHAGVETVVFAGDEICRPGEGGPTCLTRPLRRSD